MQLRSFRIRFRRRLRKQQRQVEGLGVQAEEQIERNLVRRFARLALVWRFVTAWTVLILLLIAATALEFMHLNNTYQVLQPVSGGSYIEGVLGSFTNANPIYATSQPDTTVAHLLFAGLLRYDQHNQLVGDLADRWTTDASGKVYTVHLRPNLVWQDGQRLTAEDVVYTYQLIQNPDAQSPLQASWAGITVAAVNSRTVTFTLPNPLSSFAYSLTNGIVPKHILGNVALADLRSAAFNTATPIGAGPFKWSSIEVTGSDPQHAQELIRLVPFDNYASGKPKLSSFVVHAFSDPDAMLKSYRDHELTAMIGISHLPADVANDAGTIEHTFMLNAATMVFLNNAQPPTDDKNVRQALVEATDTHAIVASLGYPTKAVTEPLLDGQLGFNKGYKQLAYNPGDAAAKLTAAGWLSGPNGLRTKDGKQLIISLYAGESTDNRKVITEVANQWHKVGVHVVQNVESPEDFQTTATSFSYGALLNSIAIGSDPDVFVYWHSSQTDPRSTRLNYSQYKSPAADVALEAGRTRQDASLRAIKYEAFLKQWQQDAPAIGLYQPRLLYVTHGQVYGLRGGTINNATDRFSNVNGWMVREARVTRD